ncbi:hypothetical protein ScPMuIL_011995 [Solemya velum]
MYAHYLIVLLDTQIGFSAACCLEDQNACVSSDLMSHDGSMLVLPPDTAHSLPPNCPEWASRLKSCDDICEVEKFPEFAVVVGLDKKMIKLEMDKALQQLKVSRIDRHGQERAIPSDVSSEICSIVASGEEKNVWHKGTAEIDIM